MICQSFGQIGKSDLINRLNNQNQAHENQALHRVSPPIVTIINGILNARTLDQHS